MPSVQFPVTPDKLLQEGPLAQGRPGGEVGGGGGGGGCLLRVLVIRSFCPNKSAKAHVASRECRQELNPDREYTS